MRYSGSLRYSGGISSLGSLSSPSNSLLRSSSSLILAWLSSDISAGETKPYDKETEFIYGKISKVGESTS